MTVPYTFGTATTSIPLSNLDANFNTPITLGNTSIYLGNTTTTIGNLTLTNVTISSGTANITSNITYATANAVVFTNSSSIGTTGANLTFDGTTFTASSIKNSALTSGRVTFAGASGLLSDNANFVFNGTDLGIGTSSPTRKLHVKGGTGLVQFESTTSSCYVYIGDSTSTGIDNQGIASTGNNLLLVAGGTEKVKITSAGLVGIGTSNPVGKLTVEGTAGALSNVSTIEPIYVVAPTTTAGEGAGIRFNASSGAKEAVGVIGVVNNATGNLGSMTFHVYNGASDFPEHMRLTNTGNLGLGATPSTWAAGRTALEIGGSTTGNIAFNGNATNGYQIWCNSYFNAGSNFYYANGLATNFGSGSGSFFWNLAPNNTSGAGVLATFTQAMTLDASGQLSVGTTTALARITTSRSPGSAGQVNGQIAMTHDGATTAYYISTIRGAGTNEPEGLTFKENATERMRIDSSGNLLVGITSTITGTKFGATSTTTSGAGEFYVNSAGADAVNAVNIIKYSTTNTTAQQFIGFTINNANTGSGQINANGASQAAFGSFSDARLKENIVDLPSQLNNILALKPKEFDYIQSEGGGHQIGFVAQDMQTVYPDAISERTDGMLVVTGWSKTEARLVKAIQEQQALIESLTTRLTALENK